MPNGNRPDTPHTSAYYPELDPTRADATRGVADRGLFTDPRPPETLATIYDEKADMIIGCSDQDTLNSLHSAVEDLEQAPNPDDPDKPIIRFDRYTIRRLVIVGRYLATFQDRTPCLLRLAALMDRSLSRFLYDNYRREFFQVVETLVSIRDEIARRTQKPYRTFVSLRDNPKLDPKVLELYPLPEYPYWKSLLDLRSGRSVVPAVKELTETRFQVDDKQAWNQAWDEIERNLAETRVQLQMSAKAIGPTPTINRHLENLRQIKYANIERQTRARFPQGWQDISVAQHIHLIIYSSVYDVLIGIDGNPIRIPGIATYSLLIPKPGRGELIRHLHSPGLYLSVGRLARYQFAVSGLRVQTLLFSGIIGFTRTQASFTFVHELQEKLQQHITDQGWQSVAAIIVEEAFRSGELSIGAVRRTTPRLIELMTRYALDETQARFRRLYDNYEDIIKQSKDILLEVIEDQIKDWAKKWLIKKAGKRIIPGVNIISAIRDLLDDEEPELMRAIIACMIMATKSKRPDDMAISAKILARIAVDETQEAVTRALLRRGIKLAAKSAKSALKGKGAIDEPKPTTLDQPPTDQPSTPPKPTQPTKPSATLDTLPPPPAQPGKQPQRQLRQQQIEPPDTGDPRIADKGTDTKAVQDKHTEVVPDKPVTTDKKARTEPQTIQLQPGVYRRRGKKPAKEAPQRKDEPEEEVERGEDIADTHRALTRRGRIDDRGIDPNLHPSQSRPESVEAAREAGVPTEVLGDGYVMTRVDLPDAAPDRPIPKARPAVPKKPIKGRAVSKSEVQNTELRADLLLTEQALKGSGARIVDVRINQELTIGDSHAGTNRPDLQLTILHAELNGRRIYIEYDRSPPTRAIDHAERIIANDPDAIVILKIIDYEVPRRSRRRQ